MARFRFGNKSFAGGVHPADHKSLTQELPLAVMPDPPLLLLPVQQHIGRPAVPRVTKGAWVREGELLADAPSAVSAVVRAPRAGFVQAVESGGTANGFPGTLIVLKPGLPPDEAAAAELAQPLRLEPLDPRTASIESVLERVREAGIVGQGGAAFPTAVKLLPPDGSTVELLILNGCECEPFLTRDYRLMLEEPARVLDGARLLARVLGVDQVVIGVEDNKPRAVEALEQALRAAGDGPRIRLLPLQTKYPQGAEKMLVEAATGRQVPPGGLPLNVGAVVQNVGTALAVLDAVVDGRVQTDAILTVSGRGVARPANLRVPVGTPVAEVLEHCGGLTAGAVRVIVGGPMMGVAQHDLAAPVTKACSGILALTAAELGPQGEVGHCLRCARCVEACPVHLMPSRLARLGELGRAEEAREQGIEVCMECGTCAFACPAGLPLVQWLRLGKQQVRHLSRSAS
ncbi:MAG: electron transport complex subunit RsxC [Candidatus Delongbacteria bacterium]